MEDLSRPVAAELLSLVGHLQAHLSTHHLLTLTMLRPGLVESFQRLLVPEPALIEWFSHELSPDTNPIVPHQGSPEMTTSCALAV